MSNMCLIVTPSIKKVADQIKQEYPKACERNGFTDQMCAEWIGLYNNTNSQNPDNVPSMKSLVNFIEKLRNQEGKSFLRDLEAEKEQYANPIQQEEIPVELMEEIADEEASITALDSRESSDPDLNKKFGGKTEVSVSEMLGNLLKSNSPFEDFIKALQENIGELGNIKIKLVPNSNSKIYGIGGLYSTADNTIYINKNGSYRGKGGKVDNTIVHEIVHAIVANSLNTPKHREELGKIFDEAREKILKKYGVESFDALPEYLRKGRLYGLQNLDEFAAEFFTNSEFISELNDENTFGKRSSKKSLFNRLVEWIKSLLPKGVTETYKRSGKILEDILLNSGGSIQTNRNLLAGRNSATNTINQENNRLNNQIEYGNDFRRVQETSRKLVQEGKPTTYQRGDSILDESTRSSLATTYARLLSQRNGTVLGQWVSLSGKGNQFKVAQVTGTVFHDIFEINRNYLKNGELVDLHDTYDNCKCYLTEDGLAGFAIEENGNLVSVFSLNPAQKGGFLYAIKDHAIAEGATHLDAYNSSKQPLKLIYEKVFGAKVASSMDYNMEYDHDGIAANHGSPQVVFMVMGEAAKGKVIEKHFNKDQYDEAEAYQHSYLPQTSLASPQASTRINIYAGTGENADLSNFAERPFKLTQKLEDELEEAVGFTVFGDDVYSDTVIYNSVEQAFQDAKIAFAYDGTQDAIDDATADKISKSIRKAGPAEAKRLGKTIPMSKLAIENWDKKSSEVMKILLRESFLQNPQALQRLLATGNATLTHTQDKGKWGTEFPRLLMEVRDELRGTSQQQPTSTIEPRFKQGIETLTGYYEGGGRLITDDYPGVPKELDDKLNNHFMKGEELSDDDYRELAKYISVVKNTDANTSQSWPYIAVPKQQTQQQSKFNVSQAEFYSGAAMGSDTAWAKEARKLGIKVVEYTPGSWDTLSQEEKNKYDAEYKEVVDRIGRRVLDINTYAGKLVRRDMMQADSADAIFAIGTIDSRGYVEGGTGYATTRGIIRGIPVFVYDRRNKQWKIWSTSSRKFINTSEPTLTPHAAVIGTRGEVVGKDDRGRDIYDINEEEKQVIRNILAKTVGQQTASQPSSVSSSSGAEEGESGNLGLPLTGSPVSNEKNLVVTEEQRIPKPLSPSYENALKTPTDEQKAFYNAFSPAQIVDRAKMIAHRFSDIIDDIIYDRRDYFREIINDSNATAEEKAMAKESLRVYEDPILARKAASDYRTYSVIMNEIKEDLRTWAEYTTDDTVKTKLENTVTYFDFLANEAAKWIEQEEGIRQGKENSSDEENQEDEDLGDNDSGESSNGNEGFVTKERFVNPFSTLSKMVKRVCGGIETGREDDLGNARTYTQEYIYSALISYLSKTLESPDDFIRVTPKRELSAEMQEEYPWGYPTFPALEKMQDKYPWAKQIIARLTNDYRKRGEADSTQLQYPTTFGSLASQFYVNFRKAFIPYGKIQVGVDKNGKPYFGVTPLNYDMEEKSQLDALVSVYNNGIVLSDDSVYNGDKTINQDNAKKMCNSIRAIVKDRNKIEGLYYAYNDYNKEGYPIEDSYKALAKEILNIIRAFGIDMTEDNLSYLITAEDRGRTIKNMLSDLWELGNKIATADPNTIADKNYLEEYKDFWKNFFVGRGFVTETNMMQSFYDPASQKTRYSYSGDNYLQKTFRHLFSPKFTLEEKRAYINEHFGKYEWFRDQTAPEGTGWKLRWLESAYDDNNPASSLPYRNINCIDEVDKDGEHTIRDYRDWTTSDKYRVMLRSWDTNSDKYAYYLAPIFADSPVSMTVRGPKYSREQLEDGFIRLIDQELARIKYVKETRAQAIKEGRVLPIASFEKKGMEFCFIPELNEEVFGPDGNMSFLDYVVQLRDNYDNTDSKAAGSFDQALKEAEIEAVSRILDVKYNEFFNAMPEDVMEEMIKGKVTQESRENLKENLRLPYYNMVYADAQIVELTTVDLAFYKNLTEFQKRFKEVYASGGRVNTNSRYGKKTGRVLTISDEEITSPSYNNISIIVNKALKEGRITASEKDYILSCYAFLGKGGVNVSDAQALRSLSSMRSVLDMQGLWDDRLEGAFQRITSNGWSMDDFNTVFQTIKPFVFSIIEKNSGVGDQKIPVPIQHKNSELALLAMWDMISGGLRNSEKLKGINRFMENVVDSEGNPIADMIQFESAGKAGNQGVVNINYSHGKVLDAIESKEIPLFDKGNRQVDTISLESKFKPNTEENSADNFDTIKEELTRKLIDKKLAANDKDGKKSQEIFNQIMDYFQPTAEEVVDTLTDYATIKDDGGNVMINPDRVEEVPFEDYMIAQPTPPHHLDATVPQGSQGRNIIIADLPEDYTITLEGRGGENITFGKEDAIDLFQSLIVENLLQDYAGLKEIFKDKKALSKKVIELASTSPVYGRDFAEAFEIENGDFKLSPNSPTIYRKVQQLVNSIIKKNIAVQKVDGAALIQASGIGLRDDLNLVYDENDKLVGAECYLPATSERLFKPLMEKRRVNGKDIMILDPEKLKKFGLDTAVGYRIPTENKSSMLPIIIKGFSPQQNGSAIFLPAEITTLSGSDFDVDKMFVVLSSFFVSEYRMADARRKFAETNDMYKALLNGLAKAGNIEALEEDKIDEINEEEFTKWFAEHKEMYRRKEPKVIKYKYDFSKSPKQNGRKARNTLLVQMMYKILTSQAGAENMFNPQNFEGVIGVAKMMKIMQDKNLLKKYMDKYSLNAANVGTHLLNASKEDLEQFVSDNDVARSPIYPQTFDYFHHQNMVGDALLAMFALQVSAAAKFQRAQITIKAPQQFTVNGRHITSVDEIYNGLGEHRLKNVSQFVGACADNGKNPNVSDFGATRDNAKAIAYMLRAGLSIKETALIINQPLMTDKKRRDELTDKGKNKDDIPVSSETLMTAILHPDNLSLSDEVAIAILCNKIINQSTSLAKLTNISRADSPNGGLPESFAKARIYKYKVDAFNAEQRTENFPFEPIEEAVSNNKIDLSMSEDEIRERINAERMAMLTAFYSLGVQSFDYLMSPYFFMLDKKFDSLVTSRILENLPRSMSDAKKEEILESLYSSYITYALSDTNLFGNEADESTFRSKREYYLNQFPKDYIQILSENPGIREAIGKIIVNRGGRLVDDNKQRIKGQRDDIVRRITGLLYMDGPEAPEARKLAKDLFIYSYFDNGLQFTATSFSTLFSTQFVNSIEGYNEFLQNLGNDLSQASVDRFIEQFYNNNPQIAVDTKRKSEKPKVKDSDIPGKDVLIINRKSNSSFENPAAGNLAPYEFIKHGDVYYILESYDTMSIRYVPLTRFGDSKVLYNSGMTLDTMATYFPYKESRDEQGEDMVSGIAAFSASMNPDNNAPFGGEMQMAIERETPTTAEYTEQSSETSPTDKYIAEGKTKTNKLC